MVSTKGERGESIDGISCELKWTCTHSCRRYLEQGERQSVPRAGVGFSQADDVKEVFGPNYFR